MVSLKVTVAPSQRPSRKMNNLDLGNLLSVSLRDSGEIAQMDDQTRELNEAINDPRLITPIGKFNVINTRHDVY